jgi:uncharacterized protein YndB with AHSA1/START domain
MIGKSLRKSVWLPRTPAESFALFTGRASEWWPESRRHTRDPRSEIRLLAEGRFWERAADGREVELGRVRTWEPPDRLVLDFYPGTDEQHPTEVVITFVPEGDGTRVTVDHAPTPASETLWTQRSPQFERSWDAVLEALARAATAAPAPGP